MRYLGVDLAWSDSTRARETGFRRSRATAEWSRPGWTVGHERAAAGLEQHADGEARAFADAPLLVLNQPRTQRLCEKQVGQRYGRWKVSANSTNLSTRHLAGVALRREALEARGWAHYDGLSDRFPESARRVSECYPYTTLVGACELGHDRAQPLYKRKPRRLPAAEWRPVRAAARDERIRRIDARSQARGQCSICAPTPSHRAFSNHPRSRTWLTSTGRIRSTRCSPRGPRRFGTATVSARCQVLGADDPLIDERGAHATIIAPARQEQRPAETIR